MKTPYIEKVRKTVTELFESISTSFHESGHCIYGLLHDFYIPNVKIFINKKTERIEGMTFFQKDDKNLNTQALYSEISFYYAGCVAEQIHLRKISGNLKMPMVLKEGSFEDNQRASKIITKYKLASAGEKRKKLKIKLRKAAEQELETHWDAVEKISHILLKKKKLNFSELKAILTNLEDPSSQYFWKNKFSKIESIYKI